MLILPVQMVYVSTGWERLLVTVQPQITKEPCVKLVSTYNTGLLFKPAQLNPKPSKNSSKTYPYYKQDKSNEARYVSAKTGHIKVDLRGNPTYH